MGRRTPARDIPASYHQRFAWSTFRNRPASHWRAVRERAVTCGSKGWREELSRLVNANTVDDAPAFEARRARGDEVESVRI